jgi:hypothetical protein
MTYIKVKNPIDKELTLQFKGEVHTIGAKTSKEFPEAVAKQWIFIYGFMEVDNSKEEKKVEKNKGIPTEEKVEVKAKKK